jgi:hypothetical protein
MSVPVAVPLSGMVGEAEHNRQLRGVLGDGVDHDPLAKAGHTDLGAAPHAVNGDFAGVVKGKIDTGIQRGSAESGCKSGCVMVVRSRLPD